MPSSFNPGGASIGTPPVALSGTPTAGQAPLAINGTTAAWGTPGGVSGAAQLPVWTYVAGGGVPAAGKFTYDSGAGVIKVSNTPKSVLNNRNLLVLLTTDQLVILTDSAGVAQWFPLLENATDATTYVILSGAVLTLTAGDYTFSFFAGPLGGAAREEPGYFVEASGGGLSATIGVNSDITAAIGTAQDNAEDYADSLAANYAPAASGVAADTGWVANESGGDKTVAVQDYDSTTLDGMTAGLNLVLAGFGTAIAELADQVEALTKKTQALETALANALRPNA